jgi:hypothetical protein
MVSDTWRLKDFTFKTDNGIPYNVEWKTQTLDLSTCGWAKSSYS